MSPSPVQSRATDRPQRWRRRAATAAGGGVTLVALWLATRGVDPAGLAQAFGDVSWPWVAAGGLVNMVTILCQSWAWSLGLAAGGLGDVPLRHAVAATWIGKAASQVLPAKLGEVVRVMVIRRHVPAGAGQVPRIVGSLVAQRVLNSLATFLIVVAAALFLPLPAAIPGGRWAVLGAVCGAVALVVGVPRVRFGGIPGRLIPTRLRALVEAFVEGAGLLRWSRPAVLALLLQMVSLMASVATVALLLHAFGVQAPAEASLLVLALMAIAGVLSAAPGGIGVTQFAIVAPLGAVYGVGADIALAFSLGLQATIAAVAVAGGLPALLHQRFARPAVAAPAPA